jgi:hypothetical protein
MAMKKAENFDFDDFINQCTREFFSIEAEPIGSYRGYFHYAKPGYEDYVKTWKHASDEVMEQSRWVAPFIYNKECSYGVVDIGRPILAIKFHQEMFWRIIPKHIIKKAVKEAKRRNVYAKLNVLPINRLAETAQVQGTWSDSGNGKVVRLKK